MERLKEIKERLENAVRRGLSGVNSSVYFIAHAPEDIRHLIAELEATEIKYQRNLEELKQLDSNSAAKDKEYKRELDNLITDRDRWKVRAETQERAIKGN